MSDTETAAAMAESTIQDLKQRLSKKERELDEFTAALLACRYALERVQGRPGTIGFLGALVQQDIQEALRMAVHLLMKRKGDEP